MVTAIDGGDPVGMTCQSFMSMSLDPPLVAFSPAKTSATYPRIRRSGRFVVNVLAANQASTASQFASQNMNRYAGIDWDTSQHGMPLIGGALAQIECVLDAEHEVGDHLLVVGRVLNLTSTPHPGPLLYFRRGFGTIDGSAPFRVFADTRGTA